MKDSITDLTNLCERAWATGFYEGEGCYFLVRHKSPDSHGTYRASSTGLTVSQADPEVLIRFMYAVGVVKVLYLHETQGKNGVDMFEVRYYNKADVSKVLAAMWDFMGPVKRAQVERVNAQLRADNEGRATRAERSDVTEHRLRRVV